MSFTFISKLHSSWYLTAAFHSNIGCLSSGPPDLGIVCMDKAVLTGLSAYLTAIIAALVASYAACIIGCIMLCSAAILSYFF